MISAFQLLPKVLAIVEQAGAVILQHYTEGTTVAHKADASPVTAADEAGEAVILAGLRALTPDLPIVAEEAVAPGEVPEVGDGAFWLVDPLDGTKEFLSRNGEFTVNIGLIATAGPFSVSSSRRRAGSPGGAWSARVLRGARMAGCAPSTFGRAPSRAAVAVASRSHRDAETDAWLPPKGSRTPCRPAARSSSAWSPRVRPTSIRASGRPWNGTRRRATPCCARPAVRVTTAGATRSSTSSRAFAIPASSPGRLKGPIPADAGRFGGAATASAAAGDGSPGGAAHPALAAGRSLPTCPRLRTALAGLDLPHPVGLAAGFDKNAKAHRGATAAGICLRRGRHGDPTPAGRQSAAAAIPAREPTARSSIGSASTATASLAVAPRLAGRDRA